jgi:hypothetical protein
MEENWKNIDEEGLYQVSNLGRVRSTKRIVLRKNGANHTVAGRILKPATDVRGYFRVAFKLNNGKLTTYKVHRLVAKAFILNLENKPEVNHINGIKDDNRVENLEWCTGSENSLHAYKNGLIQPKRGEKNGNSKLTDKQVLEIREKYIPHIYPSRKLGIEYGVNKSIILDIVNRKIWTHI